MLDETRWVDLRERLMSMNLEKSKPMPPEIARELQVFFRDDILRLQDMIGRDLQAWLADKDL